MTGYKTWSGLIITVLGLIGVGKLIAPDALVNIVDTALQLVGLLIAAYGNYKAHQTIDNLKQ